MSAPDDTCADPFSVDALESTIERCPLWSSRPPSSSEQGSRRSDDVDYHLREVDSEPLPSHGDDPSKQRGRLSNPVQRRLTDTRVDDLVARYEAGSTIESLALEYAVHRTTVISHLERRGVPARTPRKMTHQMVTDAARRYTNGETLAQVSAVFGVAPSTLTRELRLAGILIRSRGRRPLA